MGLRYILGNPGTGKTTQCINEIVSRDNMKDRLFYIVPEQFTLESEKNLLSKKESLININILGFRHFAYYLISKMGTSGRTILDDAGRAMLIKKIVLELKDKLEFYKNSVDKQGFTDNLDITITELMQYSTSTDKIGDLIKVLSEGNLKNKLKDIYIIFSKYREYMAKEYIAGDGALEELAALIPCSVVKNSEVWIDGFKSFTPQEYNVIEQLLKHCKRVNIALTINSSAIEYKSVSSFDEQFEVKRAITKITNLAKENNINIEEVIYSDKEYKIYNKEIEYLKNNYFKYKLQPYDKDVNNITIYSANNMYQEIDKICGEIKKLVQYRGLRYKDIALIIGDSTYEVPLSAALKRYDIPNFLDSRKNVSSHPLITLITSAVDIAAFGWDNTSVFKFLKTGYTNISFERIYSLENYVTANGINKYKWHKEWKYGFKDENIKSNKPEKVYIEETKNAIFAILEPLKNKKDSVKNITEQLFKVLDNINVTEKLEYELNKAKKTEDNVKTAINEAIWDIVIDVIDKMIDILGNERVSLKEYSKILNAGLKNATIGIAPPTQDYLIVGDMERTRLSDIKAMFVLGANDGNIPVKMMEKGIFTDDEKLVMEDNAIELTPNIIQKTNNGRLGIYLNIIKATHYLTISYPTGTLNGGSLKPSSIISRIKAIFPKLSEKEAEIISFKPDEILSGKMTAFDKLIQAISINSDEEFIKELYSYYINDEEYGKKLKVIKRGILSQIPKKYLDETLIPILWEEALNTGSVSKLENFTSCPFKFYMNYILRAKEKEIYKLNFNDAGTLAHKILEMFSKHITNNNIDWSIADKNYTDAFVDEHIEEYVNEMNTDIYEDNRNSVVLDKIIQAAKFSLWANVEQIKAGKFKPENFEIGFGRNNSKIPALEIELDNNKILKINGVIDRIDKMTDEDGSLYVKIIDYKSSGKSLDINKIYYGLQLQLALYMNAVLKSENAKPAGMFYFEVNEPKIVDNEDVKVISSDENFMLNRMALKGMYDENLKDKLNNAKIEILKNRKVTSILRDISESDSDILSSDSLNGLLKYSEALVKDIGNEMAKGNIEISPYKYGDENPCKYCPYGVVCDFENSSREKLRNITKADRWNDIFKKINNK